MNDLHISSRLLDWLGIDWPIIQAPMAGVSTPAMAAAVAEAGGLGSLGIGAMTPEVAGEAIQAVGALTQRSLNVNVFCHPPAQANAAREAAWLRHLGPEFERVGAQPPAQLREIYRSFVEDAPMLELLLSSRPRAVSFHFGLPGADAIRALREAGIILLATATSLDEARAAVEAGIHAVIAQGYEAGGHRGMFDPDAPDDQMSTLALTRCLVTSIDAPVIAAGGMMDGAGIAAALQLGASAVQLGTAFVACDESAADESFRASLFSDAAHHTVMTRAVSGRPARCLANRFTALGAPLQPGEIPDYPIAYDAGKALNAAAKRAGDTGYGAHWAGQGAPLARALPVRVLMSALIEELTACMAPESFQKMARRSPSQGGRT
ncbi:nitronate monooxygenase [Oleiagrimonas sp. C23AA]|uniref:NAD(P)H-dependent flavin oxidoreductase n=1 Tax=Oleiagrimonas sp. C23AA TaxID=2719047 RepID=UPI00141D853A|nr:nitronate monooxygenase [Oleiagrimonas sp. C23AA]NII09678.1 nitronate monooxygenase [Oleiagrimonas sp. C23AA]